MAIDIQLQVPAADKADKSVSFEGGPYSRRRRGKADEDAEFRDCMALAYDWGDCYDHQNWTKLRSICAETMHVDYTHVVGKEFVDIAADEYVAMCADKRFLGHPLVKAQHFIGASKFIKTSPTTITGFHQCRVPHVKYADASLKQVVAAAHAHSYNQHFYRKVDGVWKFAGLRPIIDWVEGDLSQIWGEAQEAHAEWLS